MMKNLAKMGFLEIPAYLTDTELENMISELEQADMVFAPPDLQEQILQLG